MAGKLGRNELPSGHTREDFDSFGPVATKDTSFSGCKLADMGCFKQDEGVDSNKYYFAAVVKSKKTSQWFMYVEYGRTRNGSPDKPSFQFTLCSTEGEACAAFEKQCAEKNTKRGVWEKVGSKERYVPKTKGDGSTEDLYVVRYMASRSVGLPSAKNICNQDALAPAATVTKTVKKTGRRLDTSTAKLFKDLLGGTISYSKNTLVGGNLPALASIVDARDLLQDALRRVKFVGSKVEDQIADTDLKKLTYNLYGMIPKVKPQGAAESTWILSQDNIGRWQDDLDAFETAVKTGSIEDVEENDIMQGIPADVEFIDLNSDLGKWLANWWKKSTRKRHGTGNFKIHNLWKVSRHGDDSLFHSNVDKTFAEMPKSWNNERPLFSDSQKERPDISATDRKKYWQTNTFLGFHGTKSINVPGIVREGFRLPNQLVGVSITAWMFGPGVYVADDFGKSINYCSTSSGRGMYAGNTGHVGGRHSFMFALDAIAGNPHVADDAYGYTEPPKGRHSVFGKENVTKSWGGTLRNNEWIVYNSKRVIIRYLAEVSW